MANISNHNYGRSGSMNNNISIRNNENDGSEIHGELFNTSNIISILRSNLNNENVSREKILNQVYNLINQRMPVKYSSVQKKIRSKYAVSKGEALQGKLSSGDPINAAGELKKGHLKDAKGKSKGSDLAGESTLEHSKADSTSSGVKVTSPKLSAVGGSDSNGRHVNILFDYILSALVVSDQTWVKLDILTLLEEQYETILGRQEQILVDKKCWERYHTTFSLFEHIISANYRAIAGESINLFEASTILSGSNSISVENIYQALISNSRYSIPIVVQSQTLVTFTSIAISLNLLEVVPFWFSKLLSILFIICKEDCVRLQRLQDRNPLLFQNYYSGLRRYAIECLMEVNRSYPLIFCPILEISIQQGPGLNSARAERQGLGFIQRNIHPSIWPDNLEKGFILDFKSFHKGSQYNEQLVDLIVDIILALIVNNNTERTSISKIIKEKERFLTYLVTYIMENLRSVSCWSLHSRILFLKKITKTLSIPSNILESSLAPFSYSSRINILFEVSSYMLDEVSRKSLSSVYHHVIGILNNFHLPLSFRIYSSRWLQFLISKHSQQLMDQASNYQSDSLAKFIHHLLIPKWYDFCSIKYFKSLIIFQLISESKALQCAEEEDFLEILYETLSTLQEYIIIKAPVGAHSVYLKLIFKISILFGVNQYISDLIVKYTCHPNSQISSDHINNSIQLLHLISIHSENSENFEHILLLFKTFLSHVNTLTSPRDIDPFLTVLIYLSQKSRLFTEMGNNTVISDLINSLFYISKVFLEKIQKPVPRWIYMNKVYAVCLSIITNNANNYNAIYMLNNLFAFIKGQLKIHDTQLLDSISEIEHSMNCMSSKIIRSLFELSSSEGLELSPSLSPSSTSTSTEIIQKQGNLKEPLCHFQNNLPGSESTVPYKIRFDANRKFRRQMYGLRDDSFSVFSKNLEEESTLILPFQIRYLEVSEVQTCLYGIKLSFKSSNDSLEVDPVYIPFLKSQTVEEFEEDVDEKVINKYLEETSSKVINLNNNLFLLLLIARVKFPIPGKLHIYLEFNDELGQTFYDQLEDIQISFQDYFHPSPNEDWILNRYKALSQSPKASEMVNTCKLLDMPSNLVQRNINKHLRIFETNADDLIPFINKRFNITEEFDFKHDLLINQSNLKNKDTENSCEFQINYRWFYIHLLPEYYLIIQFSITRKSSIVRIYTDLPETLPHCDSFFDSWISSSSSSQPAITYR